MFCSCCGSFLYFRSIINDLPPAAQYFTKKPNQLSSIDAYIYSCNTCSHVTLDVKPVTYYKCVIRSAGVSDEMRKFRLRQFSLIKDLYFQNLDVVRCLEIGAGSGTYAHIMAEIFGNVVATEYNSREVSNSHSNLTFVSTHPEDESFLDILSAFAPFDIICCFSYLEHLPDPSIFFTKSLPLLANGGILLVEVPNTDLILKKNLVNEIIPDHIHYFTPFSLQTLAYKKGFLMKSLDTVWHGYISSAVFHSAPAQDSIEKLSEAQTFFKQHIDGFLDSYSDDSVIVVWGAGHQALFAMSYTSLSHRVSFIVDSSPSKQGLFAAGINKLVSSPETLFQAKPSLVIVACAGYNNEVLETLRRMEISCDTATLQENKLSLIK